jgi:hypothetical protein
MSSTFFAPCLWPRLLGSPRFFAQRPLPSIIIAIWAGILERSIVLLSTLCLFAFLGSGYAAHRANIRAFAAIRAFRFFYFIFVAILADSFCCARTFTNSASCALLHVDLESHFKNPPDLILNIKNQIFTSKSNFPALLLPLFYIFDF